MVPSVYILKSFWAKASFDAMNGSINSIAHKVVEMPRKALLFWLMPLKYEREKCSINAHCLMKNRFSGGGTADTVKVSE